MSKCLNVPIKSCSVREISKEYRPAYDKIVRKLQGKKPHAEWPKRQED